MTEAKKRRRVYGAVTLGIVGMLAALEWLSGGVAGIGMAMVVSVGAELAKRG